jgi:predicted small secreted protein
MKKLHAIAALAVVVTLSSCNTAIGFGRDMRLLGTGIENKSHGRTWDGQDQQQENLPTY